jgi:hypothetical protein
LFFYQQSNFIAADDDKITKNIDEISDELPPVEGCWTGAVKNEEKLVN